MNRHGFPLFGIQNDLFTSIKCPEVCLKSELVELRLSSFGGKWLHHTSAASELRGYVLWFPAHFLTLCRSFPISVLGGTAQQTLALSFKLLVPLSSQRCLLGSKALSVSGNSTVSSMSFKSVCPFGYCYLPVAMLIIPCYWVISVCKAL